jgi:phosphatidylglycerophosphatase C
VYSLIRSVPALVDSTPTVVAAFDVDGTLTRRDSVGPFLRRLAGRRLLLALVRSPAALATGLVRRDHDQLKAIVCVAVAGIDEQRARTEGEAFAREIQARRLRDDTVARLRRHQELGHRTVLVSASLKHYLAPLGALLGVDAVLCTALEVGDDGALTGRLSGPNCRGPEKVARLRAWLAETELVAPELWAYGDSSGDDALLAMADHPVRVGRSRLTPDPVA